MMGGSWDNTIKDHVPLRKMLYLLTALRVIKMSTRARFDERMFVR